MADVTVVVMTRNRVGELLPTLERLGDLPERPPVTVVDNGSSDGTAAAVAERFPDVDLVTLDHNAGVAARNLAVRRAATPYVAFSDDDSWWAPGSLARAIELLEAHPRLGALTAHVVVEPSGHDDPISVEMRRSPLEGDPALPGVPVLGFLACATVVRRDAFLEVGGFDPRFHFGGEEELLASDLATAGWAIQYVPELRVHHAASRARDAAWRRRRGVRNALWFLWLRRPVPAAARRSWSLLRGASPSAALAGFAEALAGVPWVLRERAVVPADVERQLRRLDPEQERSATRRYAG